MTKARKYRLLGLARSAMARALGYFAILMAVLSLIGAALGRATIDNLVGAFIFGLAAYLMLRAADAIHSASVID